MELKLQESFDEVQNLEQQVQLKEKEDESKITDLLNGMKLKPEELAMVENFSKQIDLENTNLVLLYGSEAQKKMTMFSENALRNVQTQDLGEVGELITGLVVDLKHAQDEPSKGVFGFFKSKKNALEEYKLKFSSAEQNVDKVVENLRGHETKLLKDIATLDALYDQNLEYFKEISMYLTAGKLALERARNGKHQELLKTAQLTGAQEDVQAAKDFSEKLDRFEKKLYDLELTRQISMQMAPQIRLIQNNNTTMVEKINSTIANTIPLWKNQLIISLGAENSRKAAQAVSSVTNLTNELLKANAEKLHMASVMTAKESERGIVDIETLKQTNQVLIKTFDEVLQIQTEGREKRRAAELEMQRMEEELKNKLLSFSTYSQPSTEKPKTYSYFKKPTPPSF